MSFPTKPPGVSNLISDFAGLANLAKNYLGRLHPEAIHKVYAVQSAQQMKQGAPADIVSFEEEELVVLLTEFENIFLSLSELQLKELPADEYKAGIAEFSTQLRSLLEKYFPEGLDELQKLLAKAEKVQWSIIES